ncbi:MAG TPA: oxidoreductase [Bacteroidales bacterium]|nr:oxidoreductase [Bacteroidales bacterium]
MKSKIQTGLASFGLSGQVFHAPFIEAHPEFSLKKVWERTKKRSASQYPHTEIVRRYDEMVQDPDIELIVVNTPDDTHYDFCKQAIRAGKHVVVEKPFTLNTREGIELTGLARKHNRQLAVYQNRRWDGDFITVKKMLDSGMLGRLVEFEAHFDRFKNQVDLNKWREQPGPGTGNIYDLGSHMIDQALVLFGWPQSVTADLRIQRTGAKVNDYFNIRLHHADVVVTVKGGFLVREPGPRYILHGTEGSFIKYGIDPQEEALRKGRQPNEPNWGEEDPQSWGTLNTHVQGLHYRGKIETLPGNYMGFYENLYRALRHGEKLSVPAEEGLNVIRIIEAAKESSESNRVVEM